MNTPADWFGVIANIAAIVTAVIAFAGSTWFVIERRRKRRRLEAYLRAEREKGKITGDDKGQRSILHLVARVGLTEPEILQASFRSKHIGRVLTTSKQDGMAKDILLEYRD